MEKIKYIAIFIFTLLSIAAATWLFHSVSPDDISVNGQAEGVVYPDDSITTPASLTINDDETTVSGGSETVPVYMSEFEDTEFPEYSWSEVLDHLYSNVPENYDDPALRSIASEYYKQGYYLMDRDFQFRKLGLGSGYKNYFFTCGFDVLDKDLSGGMIPLASVVKATSGEFDSYLKEFTELNPGMTDTKEEKGVVTIVCEYYTLIYDRNSEILICKINDPYNLPAVG